MNHQQTREGEPTMNDPPLDDTVRARMQGIRCDIDQDLQDVSASAHSLVDWKHYVQTYPWVCVGAAAVLGFLIVPKRSAAADVAAPTAPAKNGHPVADATPAVATSALPVALPTAVRGMVDAFVGAIAGIAVREVVTYLGQNAERLLGMTKDPGTNHHDSNPA